MALKDADLPAGNQEQKVSREAPPHGQNGQNGRNGQNGQSVHNEVHVRKNNEQGKGHEEQNKAEKCEEAIWFFCYKHVLSVIKPSFSKILREDTSTALGGSVVGEWLTVAYGQSGHIN